MGVLYSVVRAQSWRMLQRPSGKFGAPAGDVLHITKGVGGGDWARVIREWLEVVPVTLCYANKEIHR
jgi:hypothetical protein